MGNIDFNVSRARIGQYASLPGTNDALILVPIESTGLEADATLATYANLGALLAAANNEQTTMGRKTLSGVVFDESTSPATLTASSVTWTAATGNPVGAMILCYDPDTTTGTDSDLIPLAKYDYIATPSGVDLPTSIGTLISVS